MLDYLARLAQQYRLPVRCAVIYLDYGAGRQDAGHHQHVGIDGRPVLTWNYSVVHLWRLQADDILALNRSSLLPLIGFTRVQDPAATVPQIVAAIRSVPDPDEQITLLAQLLGLLQDDEVIAMTQQLLTQEDIEELKRFPFLWQTYQQQQEEARIEGGRLQARSDILETLVVRFDPPTSAYLMVEQALAGIEDAAQLAEIFRQALRAPDFTTFVASLRAERA